MRALPQSLQQCHRNSPQVLNNENLNSNVYYHSICQHSMQTNSHFPLICRLWRHLVLLSVPKHNRPTCRYGENCRFVTQCYYNHASHCCTLYTHSPYSSTSCASDQTENTPFSQTDSDFNNKLLSLGGRNRYAFVPLFLKNKHREMMWAFSVNYPVFLTLIFHASFFS